MKALLPLFLLASASAFPLRALPAETRAIEMRIESSWTLQQVRDAVNRLADAGFNCVRVETFYHGSTIYDSAVMRRWGLPASRPGFGPGPGALQAVISTARSRGMTVYAWVETYYVWNTVLGAGAGAILTKYPGWSIRNLDGTMLPKSRETGYYFLSPANLEARQFLKELYAEMAATGVDGLFVDYLRYPRGALGPADPLSFDTASRERAQAELGLDITKIPLNTSNPDFKRWTLWRQQQTTDAAKELTLAVRAANPSVVFVPSIHAGYTADWKTHDSLRDWPAWWPEVRMVSMQYYTSGNPPSSSEVAAQKSDMDRDLAAGNVRVSYWPTVKTDDVGVGNPLLLYARSQPAASVSYWVYSSLTNPIAASLSDGPFHPRGIVAETQPVSASRALVADALPLLPPSATTHAQLALDLLNADPARPAEASVALKAALDSGGLPPSQRRPLETAYRLLALAADTVTSGDVDLNGSVGLDDAVRLLRWRAGAGPAICRDAADADRDGAISVADAAFALRRAAGLT